MISRRFVLSGLIAAPLIVRPGLIMPIRKWIEPAEPDADYLRCYDASGNKALSVYFPGASIRIGDAWKAAPIITEVQPGGLWKVGGMFDETVTVGRYYRVVRIENGVAIAEEFEA